MGTKNLGLTYSRTADDPPHYMSRLADDENDNSNVDKIDRFAGVLSASFSTVFRASGSAADFVGVPDIGCEYAPVPRVIKEVVAWHAISGSDATMLNLQVSGTNGGWVSIFSGTFDRPILSASYGDYGRRKFNRIANPVWPAGGLLRAIVVVGATDNENLVCEVVWAPSASYGA